MGIFKIDAKTSASKIVAVFLTLLMFIPVSIIFLILVAAALPIRILEYFTPTRVYRFRRWAFNVLSFLELKTNDYLEWVTEITTTDKERIWEELTKPASGNTNDNYEDDDY